MCVVLRKRKMVRTCIFFLYNKRQKMEYSWVDLLCKIRERRFFKRCDISGSRICLQILFSVQQERGSFTPAGAQAFWSTCSFPVLIPCADNIWLRC